MGKLSLYKSRRYLQRKQRNSRSGRPSKFRKFPSKNKDIDSTLSYSDNVDNESGHAFNFYCGADPPCDSLLAAHITSENSSSPSSSSSPSYSNTLLSQSSESGSSSEEEMGNSNNEDNVWNSIYVRNCLAMLKRDSLLKPLIEVLYENSCLKDFMNLVQSLSDGTLSPTNISFLLCLERAKWETLKTTTQMWFWDVTKKFWLVVYRLLKGERDQIFFWSQKLGSSGFQ